MPSPHFITHPTPHPLRPFLQHQGEDEANPGLPEILIGYLRQRKTNHTSQRAKSLFILHPI